MTLRPVGFECRGCGNSVREPTATTSTSGWMSEWIAVVPDAECVVGSSGQVGAEVPDGCDVFHRACWELSGRPPYSKPSRRSHDEGGLVGEFHPPVPTSLDDIAALHQRAERERQKCDEDIGSLLGALKADAGALQRRARATTVQLAVEIPEISADDEPTEPARPTKRRGTARKTRRVKR